jgi:hypothetical protein
MKQDINVVVYVDIYVKVSNSTWGFMIWLRQKLSSDFILIERFGSMPFHAAYSTLDPTKCLIKSWLESLGG